MVDKPNSECQHCGGDGVDADPLSMFDYPCIGPCPKCWQPTPTLTDAEIVEMVARAILLDHDADPDVYKAIHGSLKPHTGTATAVLTTLRNAGLIGDGR